MPRPVVLLVKKPSGKAFGGGTRVEFGDSRSAPSDFPLIPATRCKKGLVAAGGITAGQVLDVLCGSYGYKIVECIGTTDHWGNHYCLWTLASY